MSINSRQPIYKAAAARPQEELVWADKKRPFFGLPLSFTKYRLYENRLVVDSGLVFASQDELRVYRIVDLKLRQTIFQSLFNVGTIVLYTNDASCPKLKIESVRKPYDVIHVISNLAEDERRSIGIGIIESFA